MASTIYANQSASENRWTWVTGPEKGQIFSIGSTTQSGMYSSWNGGEPNNLGGENVLQFYTNGKWNDLRNVESSYNLELTNNASVGFGGSSSHTLSGLSLIHI